MANNTTTSKLVWIIPLVAVVALGWYFFGQQAPKPIAPTVTEVLQVDGVDLGKEVSGLADSLKTSLASVTDAATAQTALPTLNEAVTKIDKLGELVGKLTPEQKKLVAGLVAAVLPALTQAADKALAIPGVGDVIKPAVDSLRTKLEALSKA